MKILQLEYFIAVVKLNSFTKAADYLHISQPSLTTSIKKLEEELGYALLIRSTKEIKITERGIQFYQYALELVDKFHQTVEQMHDLRRSETPKIKISILESTAQWTSIVISRHQKLNIQQQYRVSEVLNVRSSIAQLLNYETHIAITNEWVQQDDIISIPLYEEDYFILVPKNTFPEQQSISIQSLPLILPNQTYQVRQHLDDYFARQNIYPNIIMEVDRFEAATNFVHQGLGYAVIPRFYYQSIHTSHLDAVRIHPRISRTIYLNYLKKRKHSQEVLSLIDMLKDYWTFK